MRAAVVAASILLHCLAATPVASSSPAAQPAPESKGSDLLIERLAEIEAGCRPVCGPEVSAAGLRPAIEALAAGLRDSPGIRDDGARTVEVLNRLVFHELGIRASHDLKDPANLLPSSVLERRQGYCVGIAALYLVLAERLGLPVRAVATPSHVFLRYDDGAERINIETFQQGAAVPDEQYAREHRIPASSLRRGVFLRNLTAGEFLAQVHNNLGVVYSERKDYAGAAREYETARRLDPRFPAAWYNHGNDLLLQGEAAAAARMFSRALRLYPTDVWALNNRGLAYLKAGKTRKARRDFARALQEDPAFEPARRNLEALLKSTSTPCATSSFSPLHPRVVLRLPRSP